jgi:hypothetical protein
MTDTTDLGDIYVVGQRRRPGGTFPPASGSGGYSEPPEGPVPIEVEEGEPESPLPQDPCSDPETALDWSADAAAAEALRRMQEDANDPLLDSRERSFVIAKNPVTGQIYLGNISVGLPFAGEVGFDMTGIDPANIIGLVHSHPASGPYPSGPDRYAVFPYWASQIQQAGGNPALLRMYMVGTRADPGGTARLQIRVYDQSNIDGDETNPGPEVNPDAQACSA